MTAASRLCPDVVAFCNLVALLVFNLAHRLVPQVMDVEMVLLWLLTGLFEKRRALRLTFRLRPETKGMT